MDRWNFYSSALCRHSQPNTTSGDSLGSSEFDLCSVTPFGGIEKDDTCSMATSCSCHLLGPKNWKVKKETFGVFVPEKDERRLPLGQGEGEAKQSNWTSPRYWEWPPATSTDVDYCAIPSVSDIQPKGLCVSLEIPVVQKRTFPESTTFWVNPPTVIFRQDASGKWEEFAWIRVQNKGNISRRLNLVPPLNSAFNLDWAATLKEKTTVPPGLFIHVRIQFTPKSDEGITDELVIRVEGDGGIVVPISASPQDPPLLEFDDWNCGCCLVGQRMVQTFRITNRGGVGRFWLLSESEFMNEVSEAPCSVEPPPIVCVEEPGEMELAEEQETAKEDEEDGNDDEMVGEDFEHVQNPPNTAVRRVPSDLEDPRGADVSVVEDLGEDENEVTHPPPNTPVTEPCVVHRPGQLRVPPFRLAPAAFSLEGGQKIKLKVSFSPSEPKFFHERIVILCDNGEVRWCSLKGLGIEPKTQRIITIHGENWDSDGPTTTLNLGDLSPEEPLSHKLRIRNSSTLPVYFFWVLQEEKQCPLSSAEAYAQCLAKESKLGLQEGETECVEYPGEDCRLTPGIPLTITPNQGVLRGHREVECTLDLVCPTEIGSYGTRVCLHIQQFSPESLRAMATMTNTELEAEVKRQIKGQEEGPGKSDPFSVYAYMCLPEFRIPAIPEEPTNELQIWLRCVPIQCFFEPSLLKYSGVAMTNGKRKLKFFNSTRHPVMLKLGDMESEFVNIAIEPKSLHVPPHVELCLKVILHFQRPGELERDLVGSLELPYKTVKVYLPTQITSEVPLPCPVVVDEARQSDPPNAAEAAAEELTGMKLEAEADETEKETEGEVEDAVAVNELKNP